MKLVIGVNNLGLETDKYNTASERLIGLWSGYKSVVYSN